MLLYHNKLPDKFSCMLTASEFTVCAMLAVVCGIFEHTEVFSYVCCDMQQLTLDR